MHKHCTTILLLSAILFSSDSLADAPGNFTFIVGSDPQPWRLDDMPGDKGNPNSRDNQAPWKAIVHPTYESMRSLGASFIMINGDMTEFGRTTTWNDTEVAYGKAGTKILFGLGNHDYENNVGDCTDDRFGARRDACAINSLDRLNLLVSHSPPVEIKNYDYSFKKGYSLITGSLSYSFNYNGVHFVQLNNYPDYSIGRTLIYGCQNCNGYNVTNSLSWLDKDLAEASSSGYKIILNMHEGKASEDLKRILSKYRISAIFSGHLHKQIFSPPSENSTFPNIPHFTSDAIFHGGYYKVIVDNSGMSVEALQGESGIALSKGPFTQYRIDWSKGYITQDPILPMPFQIKSAINSLPIGVSQRNMLVLESAESTAASQKWVFKPSVETGESQETRNGIYLQNLSTQECMSVDISNPDIKMDDGIQLIQEGCVAWDNRKFKLQWSPEPPRGWVIKSNYTDKCVSVQYGNYDTQGPVIQHSCDNGVYQRWLINPVKNAMNIKSLSSNLLMTASGKRITQENINYGNPGQQWSIEAFSDTNRFQIRNLQSNQCILTGLSFSDETESALLGNCIADDSQDVFGLFTFSFISTGVSPDGNLLWQITTEDGKCLSNRYGDKSPNVPIITWSCNEHDDQQWIISAHDSDITIGQKAIISDSSNLLMTNNDDRRVNQEKIEADGEGQSWLFQPSGDGHFYLRNTTSNNCIRLASAGNDGDFKGASVEQDGCPADRYYNVSVQNFKLKVKSVGFSENGVQLWSISSILNGNCLSNQYGSTAPGIPIIQWPCNNASDQKWIIRSQ